MDLGVVVNDSRATYTYKRSILSWDRTAFNNIILWIQGHASKNMNRLLKKKTVIISPVVPGHPGVTRGVPVKGENQYELKLLI